MLQSWGFSSSEYIGDYSQSIDEFRAALKELASSSKNTTQIISMLNIARKQFAMLEKSARPEGLTGLSVLCVSLFHQVPTCFQKAVLITNKPVSQKYIDLIRGTLVVMNDITHEYESLFNAQ